MFSAYTGVVTTPLSLIVTQARNTLMTPLSGKNLTHFVFTPELSDSKTSFKDCCVTTWV